MKIEPYYKGCNAVIAAPGPSLTKEVVEMLRQNKHKLAIFGVGDSYRMIDFFDEFYACDARWWEVHGKEVKEKLPNTRKWCYDLEGTKYGAVKVEGKHEPGFSKTPDKIHFGSNSGYQMLNLAYLWGCAKILLVGYNMQKVGGQTHFFKDRHPSLSKASPYNIFVQKYDSIQPDIKQKIINCTPNSALKAFKVVSLEEALCEL